MPAELPRTTSYDYAVQLSSDTALALGAKTVEFERPIYSYTENFLELPVGALVPMGVYDPQLAAWVPSRSGVVVKILDVSSGTAVLDIDGDDLPDPQEHLDAWEITSPELEKLAETYDVDTVLSRVQLTHMSAHDSNYAVACESDPEDPDAEDCASPGPPGPGPGPGGGGGGNGGGCTKVTASSVYCEGQSLGEEIRMPGSGMTVVYRSAITPGYENSYRIRIPLLEEHFDPTHPNSQFRRLELNLARVSYL